MTARGPDFLIVESWYVVALELEHHIERLFGSRSRIISPNRLKYVLSNDGPFACIFYDTGLMMDQSEDHLQAIKALNIPLIFTTARDSFLTGVPGFESVPVIGKPYRIHDLAKMISMVMQPSQAPLDASCLQSQPLEPNPL